MDIKEIEKHIRGLLIAIGEDPDREGLRETPARVARMYEEAFEGIKYTNREIAEMFGKTFEVPSDPNSAGAVVIKDISVFSDMAAKRLQLQERLGRDIAEIISIAALSPDVGVRIEGCHSCMTSRGIKNVSSKTVTKTYFGAFKDDVSLQNLLGDML